MGLLETSFASIPLPLLEVWGGLSFFLGCALALFAFRAALGGRPTFGAARPDEA